MIEMFLLISYTIIPNSKSTRDVLYIFATIVSKNPMALLFIIHQNIIAHITIQIYLDFKGSWGNQNMLDIMVQTFIT
jgi:hypothetical protein